MISHSAAQKCFMKRQICWVFLAGASAGSEFCRHIWLTKSEQFLPLETLLLEGFSVEILHLANLKDPRALWFRPGVFSAYLVLFFHTLKKEQFSFSLCFIQQWSSPTVMSDLFVRARSALTSAVKGSLPHQLGWGKEETRFFFKNSLYWCCWKEQKAKRLLLKWSGPSSWRVSPRNVLFLFAVP